MPVDEPLRSRKFIDVNPFVVGFGITENKTFSNVLRQLQVPIIENSECKKRYQKAGTFYSDRQFDAMVICAGGIEGQGFWGGDSGGPLMLPIYENDTFPFYQIGIVSYANGPAKADVPGVYGSIQYHADWIKRKLLEHNIDLI